MFTAMMMFFLWNYSLLGRGSRNIIDSIMLADEK
jgi:hypothetical protein